MAISLNTGNGAEVTAAADGSLYRDIFGDGFFVTETGNQFKAEIVSNNAVKILDGDALIQGRHVWTRPNDSTQLTIENGQQGKKRVDAILITYTNSSGSESVNFEVQKGNSTSDDYDTTVSLSTSNILTGGSKRQCLLYRVFINSLTIEKVEAAFTVIPSLNSVLNRIKDVEKVLPNDRVVGMQTWNTTWGTYYIRKWESGTIEMWLYYKDMTATQGSVKNVEIPGDFLSDSNYQISISVDASDSGYYPNGSFFIVNKKADRFGIYYTGSKEAHVNVSIYIAYPKVS